LKESARTPPGSASSMMGRVLATCTNETSAAALRSSTSSHRADELHPRPDPAAQHTEPQPAEYAMSGGCHAEDSATGRPAPLRGSVGSPAVSDHAFLQFGTAAIRCATVRLMVCSVTRCERASSCCVVGSRLIVARTTRPGMADPMLTQSEVQTLFERRPGGAEQPPGRP
jgi:hypothetical protein